jgi:phosphate starvation-inducible protein PhoH and related proteins
MLILSDMTITTKDINMGEGKYWRTLTMSRTKKSTRPPEQFPAPVQPEPANFTTKSGIRKAVRIIPRNVHQEEYLEALMDSKKVIVIAHGSAGTGKSAMAMMSAIKALSEKRIEKIILCRPAIGVSDEEHGFVPGTLLDKVRIWVTPLLEVLSEYYSTKDLEDMLEKEIIEIVPIMLIRGRNFKNCYVVLDEAQNISVSAIKSVLTRLCDNSKLIITGDNAQSDRKSGENGLFVFKDLLHKYGSSDNIAEIEFYKEDNQRHPIVTEILKIFGDI